MAEYKSSSIDKVQYQGLEIQKIYVGSELFWPIAEGSGGSDPGENPDNPPVEPEKKITGLQITSFTVDELPWNGGTITKHLEYLVSYSDGTTATSDDKVGISYIGDDTIGVNPSILRSDIGGITVRISYLDGDGNYYGDETSTRIYIAAVPAESITLTSYDVDDIPVEGGTVNSLNSFSIQVVYMNNKTYNYSSSSYITYNNSVTAGNSTNTSLHLVGYLRFTFTCPYIDNSLEFSVLVYQEAYVPVTETRLAYIYDGETRYSNTYRLVNEDGTELQTKDVLKGVGYYFRIGVSTSANTDDTYIFNSGNTAIGLSKNGSRWRLYYKQTGGSNSYLYSDYNVPMDYEDLWIRFIDGNYVEFRTEANPDYDTLETGLFCAYESNKNNAGPFEIATSAKVFFFRNSAGDVWIPYKDNKDRFFFKNTRTNENWYLTGTFEVNFLKNNSPEYSTLSITPNTTRLSVTNIPYTGGNYSNTYNDLYIDMKKSGTTIATLKYADSYSSLTTSVGETTNTVATLLGQNTVTMQLFDFAPNPLTTTYSYGVYQDAAPARDSFMTDYNLCYMFIDKQYEDTTIGANGSNVHPLKSSFNELNVPASDNGKAYIYGGISMAIVYDEYTSSTLSRDKIYYYNSATNCSLYRLSGTIYYETLTYLSYAVANGIRYNNSGFHNTASNKYQFEFTFKQGGSVTDMLSNCPYTNVFINAALSTTVSSGTSSNNFIVKILPGFEYTNGSQLVTKYLINIGRNTIFIYEEQNPGFATSPIATYSLDTFDKAIIFPVPVKPILCTTLPPQFWYPRQGTIWIGTPE